MDNQTWDEAGSVIRPFIRKCFPAAPDVFELAANEITEQILDALVDAGYEISERAKVSDLTPSPSDRVVRRDGCDRRLVTEPPAPGYRQVEWRCIYHEQAGRSCHNPLDCDLVPVWTLEIPIALSRMNKAEGSSHA